MPSKKTESHKRAAAKHRAKPKRKGIGPRELSEALNRLKAYWAERRLLVEFEIDTSLAKRLGPMKRLR